VIGDVYAVARIPRLPSLTQSTREELKNMPAKSKPSPKKKAQGKVRDIKPGKIQREASKDPWMHPLSDV